MANESDDVFVLSPVVRKYTFSKLFQGNSAREVYKTVKARVGKDFKGAPAFGSDVYFRFDEDKGLIIGSNVFYGVAINDELRKEGLWLPTITEGKQMDAAKKLTNGVYRDFGLAVYSNSGQNSKIAQRLIKEASKRGLKTPILAPLKALRLFKGGKEYGVTLSLTDDAQGLMAGEEAAVFLKEQFNYVSDNGALRVGRDNNGSWNASWYDLAYSGDYGWVDFVCGEATAKNLETAVLETINRAAQNEVGRLNARIKRAKDLALKTLQE